MEKQQKKTVLFRVWKEIFKSIISVEMERKRGPRIPNCGPTLHIYPI